MISVKSIPCLAVTVVVLFATVGTSQKQLKENQWYPRKSDHTLDSLRTVQTSQFWCPICQNTSQESCDTNLKNTTCPKAEFCMALWDDNIFVRKCANERMLKIFTDRCNKHQRLSANCLKMRTRGFMKYSRSTQKEILQFAMKSCMKDSKCKVTSCNRPGCMAVGKEAAAGTPFQCPTCRVTKSAHKCDLNIKMTQCPKATMCVALRVNHMGHRKRSHFIRQCVNDGMLTVIQNACSRKKGCEVTSCDKSGCKADF